ncbi:MAG: DEAD/DEAH box helicase [Myxococcales bacterium]|nr:DEAD/DEAH box helicase [Myxococcales bacterium]
MDLQDLPVTEVKHVGLQAAAILRGRSIHTAGDLLARTPRRYLDLRAADDWNLVNERVIGATVALVGTVVDSKRIGPMRGGGVSILLREPAGRGVLRVVFFHAPPGMAARTPLGAKVRVIGMLREGRGDLELHQPRVLAPDAKFAPIEAVYGGISTLAPATIARVVHSALERANEWSDPVPVELARTMKLRSSREALLAIHSPATNIPVDALIALQRGTSWAHQRLGFEELLAAAVVLERARKSVGHAQPIAFDPSVGPHVAKRLGFELTASQHEAIDAILRAMTIDQPMRRLLVGDVGSGKTLVAAAASLATLRAGRAVAWLCPTSIVAEQHAHTLTRGLGGEGAPIAVLLGSTPKRARTAARKAIARGQIRLVVGTHALLEDDSIPKDLGLAVVDEQHRFGVAQRMALVKDRAAHMLVVSATPIPRTLALAQYGDLDVVTMAKGPSSRQPITSRVVDPTDQEYIATTIRRALEANEGRGRVFVVVPRIEADDASAVTIAEADAMLSKHFPRDRIVILHGQLSTDAQREALHAFRTGSHPILLGTSVIEVGLDVPEANLIVILGAEHFGIAQLHQLRGRVGRGGQRAACLFVPESREPSARERLDEVAGCSDGFVLAERDLERRGAGEWFGEEQSGRDRSFRFADPLRDRALVIRAVEAARDILERDPTLASHPALDRAAARLVARGQHPTAEDAG